MKLTKTQMIQHLSTTKHSLTLKELYNMRYLEVYKLYITVLIADYNIRRKGLKN